MLGEGDGELGPGTSYISVGRLEGTAIADGVRIVIVGDGFVTMLVAAPRLTTVDRG